MPANVERVPWYRRLTLRSRMVLLTAAIVTAVVAAGAVLILNSLRAELLEAADEVATARADEIAGLLDTENPAMPLQMTDDAEAAVQVVKGGVVVTATSNADEGPAFALPAQEPATTRVHAVDELPIEDTGPYRVAARGVATASGPTTIYVAVSVDDIDETLAAATRVGAVGFSLLLLVLCVLMWWLVGRTLAPVEQIRVRADEITGQHLDSRVPEPVQQDEIGRLARTVNAMLARLEKSAEQQRRFVADAAHELRSPVASLRTQLETARESSVPTRHDALVPDLLHETLRMQALIEQLLLLARADGDTLQRSWVGVDLDETIEAVVSAQPMYRTVRVDVRQVEPVQVEGDRDLLELVVRNLIENAVSHARHSVHVALSRHDEIAVLTVDDDGPGVPIERRGEIFRRFARLDVSRDREDGGVGLGLAIVADIVRVHAGNVAISESPTGGARFCVSLPLGAAAKEPSPEVVTVMPGHSLLRR